MSRFALLPLALALLLISATQTKADEAGFNAARKKLQSEVEQAEREQQFVLPGRDGWLFFVPDVRSLLAGEFWGPRAAEVSRATKPEYADPLPAIFDFHERLKKAEIELLLAPVPAKAAIYPDKLAPELKARAERDRLDADHARFLEVLSQKGCSVVDLAAAFRQTPNLETKPLYCRTDTHWSGRGVEVAAQAIAKHLQGRDWLKAAPRIAVKRQPRTTSFEGDLAVRLSWPPEELPITVIRNKDTGEFIEPSKTSPVLLLGDSHTLVFHDPLLYATGAGLPDHLAAELGLAVDLIGVRGSGSTVARMTLARQKGKLEGKRVVIWCFAAREFTESRDGWRHIPLPSSGLE